MQSNSNAGFAERVHAMPTPRLFGIAAGVVASQSAVKVTRVYKLSEENRHGASITKSFNQWSPK